MESSLTYQKCQGDDPEQNLDQNARQPQQLAVAHIFIRIVVHKNPNTSQIRSIHSIYHIAL